MKLSKATVGKNYKVSEVLGPTDFILRLKEMGITKGEKLQVLRKASLGGLIEIKVKGYCITLRRDEAKMVELLSEEVGDEGDGRCPSRKS